MSLHPALERELDGASDALLADACRRTGYGGPTAAAAMRRHLRLALDADGWTVAGPGLVAAGVDRAPGEVWDADPQLWLIANGLIAPVRAAAPDGDAEAPDGEA